MMNKIYLTYVKEKKIRKTMKSMPHVKNRSDVLMWRKHRSIWSCCQITVVSIFMLSSCISPGIFGSSFPEGFRLSFPTRTNYMYAVVKHSIPMLRAFTICLWLRPAEGGIGTPLSYAVPAQPNELVLLQGLHTPTELLINDKVSQAASELTCPLPWSNRSSQGGLCNALWLKCQTIYILHSQHV